MTIERIDPSEIPARGRGVPTGTRSEEGLAVEALAVGEAVKFPCRWNHVVGGWVCSGITGMRVVAKRNGFEVTCRCHEKTLYIHRVA